MNIHIGIFALSLVGLLCVSIQTVEANDFKNYEEYQLVSADVRTPQDLKFVKTLGLRDDLDFWRFPRVGGVAEIMTHAKESDNLISLLKSKNIESKIIQSNVQMILEEERTMNARANDPSPFMTWDNYQTWETMEAWIKGLEALPTADVTVVGASTEGRPIYMVKVSNGPSLTDTPKKAIFIEANIHAREWISSAVATFIIQELTSQPDEYKELLDSVDLYINPMSNPDGYAYSHHNTSTRLWRKTRSTNPFPGQNCLGADPNRNFEFMWGGESTSSNPCSDSYYGTGPWSEPEVRAIRDAMRTIRSGGQEVQVYIGLHACGNVWLLSWGWTEGIYPEDFKDLEEWGTRVVAKIKEVNGTEFETGQGADIFYGVGGASDDYAKSAGIKYATTAELRCGTGSGFILPPDQIIPTGREILAGIQETGRIIVGDDSDEGTTTKEEASVSTTANPAVSTINAHIREFGLVIIIGFMSRINI